MKNRTRTIVLILALLSLGTLAVTVFLAKYLGRNRATVVLVNASGTDLLEAQLQVSSLDNEQETGPIPKGDSATLIFRDFSDGVYVLTARSKDGRAIRDSAGRLARGTDSRDRLILESAGDGLRLRDVQQPR